MALRPVRLRRIVAASALSVVAAACIGSGATPDGSDERAAARGPTGNDSAVSSVDPGAGIMNLDHLIFIVQENRSFDHYFGTYPGADGIPMDAQGRPTVCARDPVVERCLPHTARMSS